MTDDSKGREFFQEPLWCPDPVISAGHDIIVTIALAIGPPQQNTSCGRAAARQRAGQSRKARVGRATSSVLGQAQLRIKLKLFDGVADPAAPQIALDRIGDLIRTRAARVEH